MGQLQGLLDRCSPVRLNAIHVTAFTTHLAGLLQAGSAGAECDAADKHPPPAMDGSGHSAASGHADQQKQQAVVLSRVLQLLQEHAQQLDARGLANCLWGVARSLRSLNDRTGTGYHVSSTGPSQQQDLHRSEFHGAATGSLQVSHTAKAVAVGKQLLQRVAALGYGSFTPQHLANVVWAAAVLGLELPDPKSFFAVTERQLPELGGQVSIDCFLLV